MKIDLIILGILIEKSQSAYDIQKDIEYHHFERWSKISIPSIYKKVIQMEEKGYLNSKIIKGSKLSNKAIYSITDNGRDYFEKLMVDLSLSDPHLLFDFNIVIANITKLSFEQGSKLLKNLKGKIKKALQDSDKWEKEFENLPFNGKAIINQQCLVYQTLMQWIETFEETYTHYYKGEHNGNL